MAPATVLVRSPEVTPSADPSVPILLTPAPVTPPAVGTVAAPCPALPTCVKLDVSTYRVFLLSTGLDVGADLVAAWRKGSETQAQHSPCQLLHYNCSHTHEKLVLLDALDRIRDGFFDAVILVPPASSMVKGSAQQQRSRSASFSRSRPLGLSDLSAVGVSPSSSSRTRTSKSQLGLPHRHWNAHTTAWACFGFFPRPSAATPLKVPLPSGPSRTHVYWHITETCADWLSSVASSRTLPLPGRSPR